MWNAQTNGSKWICSLEMTDGRRRCVWCDEKRAESLPYGNFSAVWGRREEKMKRELRWINAVFAGALLVSAGPARAQETQEAPPVPPVVSIQGGAMVGGDAFFEGRVE